MTQNLRFLGGSTGKSAVQYSERRRFVEYYRSKNLDLLDTLYEKKLYGFLNKKGHVVMPVSSATRFGNDSGPIQGLNYVVDAFNSLRDAYRKNDSIVLPSPIQDMVPKRSYDEFDENYAAYERLFLQRIMPMLVEELQSRPVGLLEFVEAIEKILFKEGMSELPMTRSGFALSTYSSAYSTGLYIDIVAEQDGSIDLSKPSFYEDDKFECYVRLAKEYGFYVDANAPWRLVLNLEDKIVKKNILNGRPEKEFDKFYHDVYTVNVGYDDYWTLRSFCQKLYVEYNVKIENSFQSMPRLEGTERWIEFLLVSKFREASLITRVEQKREKQFTDVLKRAVSTNSIYGLTSNVGALGYINDYFGRKLLEKLEEYKNTANTRHSQQLQGHLHNRLESI